jgi:hypothetical protein
MSFLAAIPEANKTSEFTYNFSDPHYGYEAKVTIYDPKDKPLAAASKDKIKAAFESFLHAYHAYRFSLHHLSATSAPETASNTNYALYKKAKQETGLAVEYAYTIEPKVGQGAKAPTFL